MIERPGHEQVLGGLDHDPAGRSGMAQLAGRVLATSAAAGRAQRSVETGTDYTMYSVTVPGDRLQDELDDVAAWMSQAAPTCPRLVDGWIVSGKSSGL